MIKLSQPSLGQEEIEALERVINSGLLSQGPESVLFEREFSESEVSGLTALAVNSGTSALHLALLANGIGPGDEVIVPSFSFAATANSVALTGATPVFADIDLELYTIDPKSISEKINSRTKAIMPVHLYGNPADMVAIGKIAIEHNLLIIEDAAQAHGARLNEKPVGAFGASAAFSFYGTKNMTSGEGGIVVVSNSTQERLVKLLRNQGMIEKYKNEIVGFNYRMSELHAAIGRVQLRKLSTFVDKRIKNAEFYSSTIRGVHLPVVTPTGRHSFHQYTIRLEGFPREVFMTRMLELGIETGIYYPVPIHKLPAYNLELELPNSITASQNCVSLPVHQSLSEDDLSFVANAVNTILG